MAGKKTPQSLLGWATSQSIARPRDRRAAFDFSGSGAVGDPQMPNLKKSLGRQEDEIPRLNGRKDGWLPLRAERSVIIGI